VWRVQRFRRGARRGTFFFGADDFGADALGFLFAGAADTAGTDGARLVSTLSTVATPPYNRR
jgi:ABC-type antimicrobial peptide transport system permease subunit